MATVTKKARVGRPSGGGSVTREKIVEVALAQIDEAGLPALSMRDIAARLGVYPATVQWHIRSKEELLAEVWPYLVAMLGALAIVTLWPDMVLWLPRLAGYTG